MAGKAKGDTSVSMGENCVLPAPGDLRCATCDGVRFRSCGTIHKKRQYACAGCGVRVLLVQIVPEALPCPYCGGQCVKNGFGKGRHKNGARTQRFLCRGCGRTSCELYPATPLEDLGGYLFRANFGLDAAAREGLNAFCQHFGMRETEAVRAVFRASRAVPLDDFARVRWERDAAELEPGEEARDARRRVLRKAAAGVDPAGVELKRLPDARSAVSRARLSGGLSVWEARHVRRTGVVQQVAVALDRTALAGLVRAMEHLDTRNRQEAARFLLRDALSRFGAFVVLPALRGARAGRG